MVAAFRVSVLAANVFGCPLVQVERERQATAQEGINDVDSGEIQRQIDKGIYTPNNLRVTLLAHLVDQSWKAQSAAIEQLDDLLSANLPKKADGPDWVAVVEAWAAAGAGALAALYPAAAAVPVAVTALQGLHTSEQEFAKRVKSKQLATATWKDMLNNWKAEVNKNDVLWSSKVENVTSALNRDFPANLADTTRAAWAMIKQTPSQQDWYNSFYAAVMASTRPTSTVRKICVVPGTARFMDRIVRRDSSCNTNANYFVHQTQNGKTRWQGVLFTPQPPGIDACKAVEKVLAQNGACWSPHAPGLQGFEHTQAIKGLDWQARAIPSSTQKEKVGDFKVLLSATDEMFIQYDCKDINDAKGDANKVVDKYEGCFRGGTGTKCNAADRLPKFPGQFNPAPCRNSFWGRDDPLKGFGKVCAHYMDGRHGEGRKNVLVGLRLAAIQFCKTYIEPVDERRDRYPRSKYTVAAVNWADGGYLCEQCKDRTLLEVFQGVGKCNSAGVPLVIHPTSPCEAIPEPGHGGAWCEGRKPGFAEYCWGACRKKCGIIAGYEQVGSCWAWANCKGSFSTPLCKRKTHLEQAASVSGSLALPAPAPAASPAASNSCDKDPLIDECSFDFNPYVQCSDSGDECWLTAAQVEGTGTAWSSVNDSVWVSFDLVGVEPGCVNPPVGVEDACTVQIYSGSSCLGDIGGKLTTVTDTADPFSKHFYVPMKFSARGYIQYELSPSATAGRTVVVHDSAGDPVACAEIPTICFDATADSTTTTNSATTTSQETEKAAATTSATTTTSATGSAGNVPSAKRCRACNTMCNPCRDCTDSKDGSCEKCWHCHDYDDDDDDDDEDDDDSECLALSKDHNWDDDEVQCLSEQEDDCRLCWQVMTDMLI